MCYLSKNHANEVTNTLEIELNGIIGSDISIDGFKGNVCKEDSWDKENVKKIEECERKLNLHSKENYTICM